MTTSCFVAIVDTFVAMHYSLLLGMVLSIHFVLLFACALRSSLVDFPPNRRVDILNFFFPQVEESISILNFFPPNRGVDFYFEFVCPSTAALSCTITITSLSVDSTSTMTMIDNSTCHTPYYPVVGSNIIISPVPSKHHRPKTVHGATK
jgi:hypothetical protein